MKHFELVRMLKSPDEGGGDGGGVSFEDTGSAESSSADTDVSAHVDGGQEPPPETYEQLVEKAKSTEEALAKIKADAEELRLLKLTPEQKEAEEKAAKEKEAEEAKAAKSNIAPDEYEDFKMPKDMPVDEALLNDFKPLAKELNLPQEKAQKLIDLYAEKVAPLMIQRQQEAWNNTRKEWLATAKSDKEIGGDNWQKSVDSAKRVINTIGTPELKEAFNVYGLGDHPELIRAFARVSAYLREDNMEQGGVTKQAKSIAQTVYPNMNP